MIRCGLVRHCHHWSIDYFLSSHHLKHLWVIVSWAQGQVSFCYGLIVLITPVKNYVSAGHRHGQATDFPLHDLCCLADINSFIKYTYTILPFGDTHISRAVFVFRIDFTVWLSIWLPPPENRLCQCILPILHKSILKPLIRKNTPNWFCFQCYFYAQLKQW